MKRLLKKIAAVIATAAIAVSALVIPTTTANAAGVFDNAIKMEQLEYYTKNLEEDSTTYFKITLPSDGKLILRCSKAAGGIIVETKCSILNTNAETVSNTWEMRNNWQGEQELKKGTYYVKILSYENQTLEDFYYTFTPTDKPSVKLSITLKKGQTLQLGSILENSKSKTTWLSTKKTVATVSSKGLVTAKKTGKTTIRATLDSGEYAEITVKVTK